MNGWMFALLSGAPQLVTKTFTESQSFTVPFGVSSLVSVVGKGQDGTPAVFQTQMLDLFYCSLTNATGDRVVPTSEAANYGAQQALLFDGSGVRTVNYAPRSYQIDASNLALVTDSVASVIVRGSGTLAASQTSGNLTQANYSTNYARYSIDVQTAAATNGAAASGFGQSFAGGTAGPAATSTVMNVAVTGGSSYNVVVPAGGSITISYYQ